MRNEIFNRINQNRIQYYSELKSQQHELKNEKNSHLENTQFIEKKNKVPHTNFFRLETIRKIDFSVFFLVFTGIHKQLSSIVSSTNKWTIKIAEPIVHKANRQTDRLTNGLSRISSQLFEDSYEFQEHEESPNEKLSLAYSFGIASDNSMAINYELNKFGLVDQFNDWLNKVYSSIVIFLESDSWFEEINRSSRSSPLRLKKYTINQTELNPSDSRLSADLFQLKGEKFSTSSFIIDGPIRLLGYYFTVIAIHLKILLTKILPAINRFI